MDLSTLGNRELLIATELLKAYAENNKTEVFKERFYKLKDIGYNNYSGDVFLTDENSNCGMLNDGIIDLYFSLPYDGKEGFLQDLVNDYDPHSLDKEDLKQMLDYIKDAGSSIELPKTWDNYFEDCELQEEE